MREKKAAKELCIWKSSAALVPKSTGLSREEDCSFGEQSKFVYCKCGAKKILRDDLFDSGRFLLGQRNQRSLAQSEDES